STVSKVLELVEEASAKKGKAEQFITVFARVYTPIVVGAALLLILAGSLITKDISTWVYRGMTFLLISCPCALVISIPLSFFGGIGGAGKKGILIKGGNYMDVLNKVSTLVLDKTGTITKGNFALGEIEPSDSLIARFGDSAESELIRMAAISESYSTHPIAVSILNRYGKEIDRSTVSDVKEIAGKGVAASFEGHTYYVGNAKLMKDVLDENEFNETAKCSSVIKDGTLVYVAEDGLFAGHLHIVDEIKDDAVAALKECRKVGIDTIVMLTGDNEKTAEAVSRDVGIDRFYANQSPIDKVDSIEKILNEASGKVAFVGDGINDAPVLTRADVGIAMGAMGSDAAIEAADVVIMTDELSKIVEAKRIAKKTLRIVKENIWFALGIKVLVLILAALGFATMWAAIFADVGVAVIAILNSMRALK
ncbi:MAG: heavy metal translocating P-type ATPase, partial [Lachnospiraceae bacterium]|nr:heavy metal translocating P-type ATPase [Lachnospiraceae bacterium]